MLAGRSGEDTHGLGGAGDHVIAVELGDIVHGDTLGASGLALVLIGAVTEAEGIHLADHGQDALILLRLTLGQQVKVSGLGGGEEHGGAILAAGHAGTATDAGSGIERGVRRLLTHGHVVGVRRGTGTHVNETTGSDDLIQGLAVHHQIAQDGESLGAERLDPDGITVLELTHVQLAGGDMLTAVGHTVDGKGAHTANALSAIVVEVDGLLPLVHEALVDDVQHLQEGSLVRNVGSLIGFDAAPGLGIFLAPDLECEIEVSHNRENG